MRFFGKRFAIFGACMVLTQAAVAVELGGLHVFSTVGKPLDAEVRVFDLAGIPAESLVIRVADSSDIAVDQLPIEHPLYGVRYYVAKEGDNVATIRFVSKKPMTESFVSFLLEMTWSDGRILREFTSLLPVAALPVTQTTPVTPTTPTVQPKPIQQKTDTTRKVKVEAPESQKAPSVAAEPVSAPPVARPKSIETLVDYDETFQVAAKETLWNVSLRAKPEGATNQQMMLAFYRANPEAFFQGRFDGLQKGAYLVKPSLDVILQTPPVEAYRIVKALLAGESPQSLAITPFTVAQPKSLSPKPAVNSVSGDVGPDSASTMTKAVVVGPQETLWDIVVAQRPGPWVNTRQMMVATVKKNPTAFENGNINRMLKGVRLTMPTQDEINALTPEQASLEVRRQIAQWRKEEGLPVAESSVGLLQNSPVEDVIVKAEQQDKPAVTATTAKLNESMDVTSVKRKTVIVQKQDTLWTLANDHKPTEEATTGQMIKAIIRLNPEAFVEGSMHDMVEGATLKIPRASDLIDG